MNLVVVGTSLVMLFVVLLGVVTLINRRRLLATMASQRCASCGQPYGRSVALAAYRKFFEDREQQLARAAAEGQILRLGPPEYTLKCNYCGCERIFTPSEEE
ncbi:MAG: hypothetical protein KDD69_07695 [Bdellovibrionales bacterium]|nr:hypothetical protein [Bdellovibrionales bacterium]